VSSPSPTDGPGRWPPTHSPSVSVIRPAGLTSTGRLPARSSATRRAPRAEGVYAVIVASLVLLTTALSFYDAYHLLLLMAG
jgi:hypothetical protein